MKIIAHRGLWEKTEEKNRMTAFDRALEAGFGIETDVRELSGRLVLSHDIADNRSVVFEDFLKLYRGKNSSAVLALNVKEDGIQEITKKMLEEYEIRHFFFFDMSIPEMVVYRRMGLSYFTRLSDIEHEPVLLEDADGVWVDAFFEDWDMAACAREQLQNGKKVSMISPEIHGRKETTLWERLSAMKLSEHDGFYLCTDYPEKAGAYFKGGEK